MNADEVSLSRDVWSRSGATAGRGFHYQDAVGAWWAARMLAAPGRGARIVPEGFEDLHIEGDDYVYIQVKSRQEPAGDFTARQVARFLAEMWEKHTIRIREGHPDGSMVLVLERPVAGCRFDDLLETLADLPSRHEIAAVLSEIVPTAQLESSLGKSSILVLGWEDLSEAAMNAIAEAAGVMPSTSRMIERELRLMIAEAADANATVRRRQDTRGIDRLGAQAVVDGLVRLVDRASLEAALLDGTCDVVDFRLPETPGSFFEGMPAKPGHIAAGIPAARSSLVSDVLNALEMRGAALIAGPSGVGKSTLMWSAVYRRRDMVWYRINRLDGVSVSKIVELARASRAGERAQVGFVVDGVGIGESQSWDQLQRSLAMHPGILLLGSVRHEDMFPLETIQDCGVITVSLDEEVAQEIHSKLVELGVTAAPHCLEIAGTPLT
jgi:hypothetical protein